MLSKITINLVVHNGESYLRRCLDSVLAQSYSHENMELNIWDNASKDRTWEIVKNYEARIKNQGGSKFFSHNCEKNLGMWPGQEELLKHSHGEYIVALSVDVILHPDFIKTTVEVMNYDHRIGALQAKVYKYDLSGLRAYDLTRLRTATIDTLGFQIFRSRRIINIGHGETDHGQYDLNDTSCSMLHASCQEIFAAEGAVPVFRRQALEDCRLVSQVRNFRSSTPDVSLRLNLKETKLGKIIDPDFFWYGDDLDLAWRMRIFGWKQIYAPNVIAWHDRKTTKSLASGSVREFIKIRKTIPKFKRRLDWRNTTLAIIKNDFASNLWRDSYYILWRQLRIWGYFLLFEPAMFLEIFKVAKLLPKMLKRRSEIMRKAKISAKDFRKWIT